MPPGLPDDLLKLVGPRIERESTHLTARRLDTFGSVITGCALALAETGTLVLDAVPDQGSRKLTLVPDHHICIVYEQQIVGSVPQATARLSPTRPMTWISGPSASSDIELNRVEGVHGPRHFDVLVVAAT
ncbi:lactate utilization protein C [Streptomyces sp. NPDC017520]|uniref:lactate utilization protein C n=1 Tax=Streptomyces sp. NPDC017520 TaxID=3364998 RepID=UPI003792C45D